MSEKFTFLLVFSGIGVLMLLIALFELLRLRRFVAESLSAEGTVVRLDVNDDGDGTTYAPVVRFTTARGREVEFRDPLWSSPAGYRVGQRVEVLYRQREYKQARIASSSRLYFAPGLLIFLGLVFGLTGPLVFFFAP